MSNCRPAGAGLPQPEVIFAIRRRAADVLRREQQRMLERIARARPHPRDRADSRPRNRYASAAPQPGQRLGPRALGSKAATVARSFAQRTLLAAALAPAAARSRPARRAAARADCAAPAAARARCPCARCDRRTGACRPPAASGSREARSAQRQGVREVGLRLEHAVERRSRSAARAAPARRPAGAGCCRPAAARRQATSAARSSRAACRAIRPRPSPACRFCSARLSSV